MANPTRNYDDRRDIPTAADPINDPYAPVSPLAADPVNDPRIAPNEPYVNNTVVERGSGNGVLIAAALLVLAVVGFFVFGPGISNDGAVTDQPTASDTAVTPAPTASAPVTPSDETTSGINPAEPATPNPSAAAPAESGTSTMAPGTTPVQPAPVPAQ